MRISFSQEDAAAWLSAVGTIAAVAWGVWQVNGDRRRRKAEQVDAIHEIAAASERVATIWDELAQTGGSNTPPLGRSTFDQQLKEAGETIGWLLQRPDLTDGAVRCGVAGRQLAERLVTHLAAGQGGGPAAFQADAQRVLTTSRALRRAHGIRGPRKPHTYRHLSADA